MSAIDKRLARLEAETPPGEFDHLSCSELLRMFGQDIDAAEAAGMDLADIRDAIDQFDADERQRAAWDAANNVYANVPLPTGVRWPHTLRNLEWWERTYP